VERVEDARQAIRERLHAWRIEEVGAPAPFTTPENAVSATPAARASPAASGARRLEPDRVPKPRTPGLYSKLRRVAFFNTSEHFCLG